MAKAKKKTIPKEQLLKINGTFEDVIAASVRDIDLKKTPAPKKKKADK